MQWAPDRSLAGERLARRAIQVGLSGDAVRRYCDEWIRSIADITSTVREAGELARAGRIADAAPLLPAERTYPLSPALARQAGAEPGHPTAAHTAEAAR